VGVGTPGELEKLLAVFAHPGFDVMAGYVVPHDAIVVEVVEHCDAGLIVAVLSELPVIGLSSLGATSEGPVSPPASSLLVGGRNAVVGARPEPSVHNMGFEVRSVAAIEVTLPP